MGKSQIIAKIFHMLPSFHEYYGRKKEERFEIVLNKPLIFSLPSVPSLIFISILFSPYESVEFIDFQ